MKKIFKMLSVAAVSSMLVFALTPAAFAQHDHDHGGGGGGGSHPSGGGGGGGFHPSGGSFHPSGGNGGGGFHPAAPGQQRGGSQTQHSSFPQTRVNNNANTHPTIGRPNFGAHTNNGGVIRQNNHMIGGASHVGVTGSFRSVPRQTYGHNHVGSSFAGVHAHGYLPGNTYYHFNHGYYHSYYTPRLGFSIGVLPYGYYPFYYGDYEYYFSDGLFYQYDNDQYTVVEPPVGAQINTLPSNAQSIVINGQQFYEVDGVYYKPITKDDGTQVYEVAGKDGELNTGDDDGSDVSAAPQTPQIGDMVPQLPQGSRRLKVNGQQLFLSPDGIYYQQVTDQSGATEYKIVGLPDDDSNDQQQQ